MRCLILILALLAPGPISAQAFGARQHWPTPIHVATSSMVLECLKLPTEVAGALSMEIRWFAADSIVAGDRQAWGMTVLEPKDGGTTQVFTRKEIALNPQLISHELIHVLIGGGGDPYHEGPEWRCVIPDFAMRQLPSDPRHLTESRQD